MAKKKTSKTKNQNLDITKLILMAIVLVGTVLMILPLFLNVWNQVAVFTNSTTTTQLGGYFADLSSLASIFEGADATFMGWASIVAGVALIIALVGAVAYFVGNVMKALKVGGNLGATIAKFASIIMILAGIVIIVMTLLVAIPSVEAKANFVIISFKAGTYSAVLGIGACFGMMQGLQDICLIENN